MSFTNIDTSLVQNYGRNVFMMAQQTESRLRDKVIIENPTAERHYFELYDTNGAMNEVTTRNADVIASDTEFQRRAVDIIDYDDAKYINKFDQVKMLIDPMSPVVMAQAAQMGRQIDDIIIASAFVDMKTGKTGSGTSSLPVGQVVGINSWAYGAGTGNSNLTVSKILEAKAILDANEVPQDGRYFVVDAINHTKLLATAEASSRDFVSQANIERGELKFFAGFEFVRSERLLSDSNSYKRCFAFQRTGMGLAINKDAMSRITERDDKRGYPWQAYICLSMGATRLENKKVVEVKCLAT